MIEDNLKDIFVNFKPELTSDFSFMNKLKHNLDQVEIIRQHNIEVATKRKKAAAIAACAGFIVGFLFSLALPYIGNVMMNLQSSLPSDTIFETIADNYLTIAWLIIGATTVFISLNAYDLSLWLMKQRHVTDV